MAKSGNQTTTNNNAQWQAPDGRLPHHADRRADDAVRMFETHMGIQFRNKRLLREALTHCSFLNESTVQGLRHNERLEFLGDAVLEIVVSEHLFRRYPDMDEGRMTMIRSSLVCTDTLAAAAEKLSLNECLLFSRGEQMNFISKRRGSKRILASVFEAVLGAIYLDRGLGAAEMFCLDCLLSQADEYTSKAALQDPKSRFQELAQEKYNTTPRYEVTQESGPDNDKDFRMRVMLQDLTAGEGRGGSKKDAEYAAAVDALKKIFGIDITQKK